MTPELAMPPKSRHWLRWGCGLGLFVVLLFTGFLAHVLSKSNRENPAIERLRGVADYSGGETPMLSLPRFVPTRIQSLLPQRLTINGVRFRSGTQNPRRYLRDITALQLTHFEIVESDLAPTDLEEFSRQSGLRSMKIRKCKLADGSLSRLQNLPRLMHLSLERSTMSPKDEIDFPTLPQLVSLNLSRCNVSEQTLRRISDHPQIRTIDLNSSTVTDEALKHLRRLPQREKIHLGKNWITGIGLVNLEAPVTKIYLYGTNADDVAMTVISGLSSLQSLDLEDTRVTTLGVRKLQQLPNIQELDLDGCPLGDEVREILSAMPHLTRWTAQRTRVSLPNTSGL